MQKLASISFAVALCFIAAAGVHIAIARSAETRLNAADKQFVQEASQGGAAEVELGRLATQKASNENVKQFGQRMVDDHSHAGQQLMALALSKGIEVSTSASARDKALAEKLEKLSGPQFDDAYMSLMVRDHKRDVADFEKASRSAIDPQVKQFAAQTLPTLQEHLRQAEEIAPEQSNIRMQDH